MNDPATFGPPMLSRRLEAAMRDVQSSKSSVRLAAARDLSPYVDSTDRDRVVAQLTRVMLDDSNTEVRAAAVLALVDGGAAEAVGAMLKVARGGPPRVRQMALLALGEIAVAGMPEATEVAHEALESELPALRYQGLVTLKSLQHLNAIGPIALRAADEDPEVRWVVVRLLDELWTSIPDSAVNEVELTQLQQEVHKALRPLLYDDNPRVRATATLVLARIGDHRAAEAIPRLLDQTEPRLDVEDEGLAIELAGHLQIQAAKAALGKRAWPLFWETPTSWRARVALAQLGDERARSAVLQSLHSRSPSKCARAIEAVGRIGLVRARPRLLSLLENPTIYDVDAIRTALKRLDTTSQSPRGSEDGGRP